MVCSCAFAKKCDNQFKGKETYEKNASIIINKHDNDSANSALEVFIFMILKMILDTD